MTKGTTKDRPKNPAAVFLGHLGGRVRSPAQTAASKRNIRLAIKRRWATKRSTVRRPA